MSRTPSGLTRFADSIADHEAWMREELGDWLVAKGLRRKHERMREHPFLFLRATCWRWAEAAPILCPELVEAPRAPSVGDAHAGNFGLWRDADSRLVWGVNDYDEAARLAWPLDLVRLCASVALAMPDGGPGAIAGRALAGYAAGLAAPRPFVLERDHLWLRDAFAASDKQRREFWDELAAARPTKDVPAPLRKALVEALPDPDLDCRIAPREAGAGSLGRPRYVALAAHRGGPVAVEVKGVLPSCWRDGREKGLAHRMVHARNRAPDPMFLIRSGHVTRRLAPNSRKLTLEEISAVTLRDLIGAMAADLAAIHAVDAAIARAIRADLRRRKPGWLEAASVRVADWTTDEHDEYRSGTG